MRVSEALDTRITCRAFLDKPVPKETVVEILEVAKRAPSGGNLQPWHVYVVAGPKLQEFVSIIREKRKENPFGEGTEYDIYPKELKDPYKARRFKVGEDMYGKIGIAREDKAKRLEWFGRNYEFFGAPVALFFSLDRQMNEPQWSDLGMFMQSIMLLAREHGLHTASQEAWALWYKTIQDFVGMPEDQKLFCAMALGYMDESDPVNSLRSQRAPLDEFVTFDGFA